MSRASLIVFYELVQSFTFSQPTKLDLFLDALKDTGRHSPCNHPDQKLLQFVIIYLFA